MWRAAALGLAGLLLASCQPVEEPAATGLPGYDPNLIQTQAPLCEKRGGTLVGVGGGRGQVCSTPTRDAGKYCTAATQCEGLCLARSRSCAPVKPLYGCHDILTDRGTVARICID